MRPSEVEIEEMTAEIESPHGQPEGVGGQPAGPKTQADQELQRRRDNRREQTLTARVEAH